MPTHNTTELGLAFAVAAFGMPAAATSLAGVGRIDQSERHTRQPRLVADERSQLAEGPIAVSYPSRFPYRRPRADVPQVFQRNHTFRVFGFLDKLFCYAMVGILLKPTLFTSQLPQMPFGGKAATLLQSPAQVGIPAALAFDTLAAVVFAITINRQVGDTQINPKHAINDLLIWLSHLAYGQQVERAPIIHQITFTFARRQQCALMLAGAVRNVLAARERPDRHDAFVGIPGQVAVIEGNGAVGLEGALNLAIQFIGICDLGDATHQNLRAQVERGFDVVVDELLKRKTTKLTRLPGSSTNRVTGGIGLGQGCQQCRVLFGGSPQFDLGDEFHTRRSVAQTERVCKYWAKAAEAGRLLPGLMNFYY